MAEMIATRTMTVLGKEYQPGQPIPASKLAPARLKQLVAQRRVEPSRAEAGRSGRKEG